MSYQTRTLDYSHDKEFLIDIIKNNLSHGADVGATVAWSYEQNPGQNSRGRVLEFSDKSLQPLNVGVLSIGYRDFYCGKKKVRAALCGDFVVTSEHRSLQPALKLIKDSVNSELESCPFVYGFPNDKALGVLKMAGFKVVGKLTRYVCVLRTGRYINEKIKIPFVSYLAGGLIDAIRRPFLHFMDILRTQNVDITETGFFDVAMDIVPKHSKINHLVFNCRSSAYLNWRYFSKPGKHYTGLICNSAADGRPMAYAVLEFEQQTGAAHVRDMLYTSAGSFRDLLFAIREWAYRNNAESVSISILAPEGITKRITRAGFKARESVRHVLVRSNNNELMTHLLNANNWYVMDGDEDQ